MAITRKPAKAASTAASEAADAFISGAPDRRPEWGEGRYFTLDITLDAHTLALMPGMSVRVTATPARAAAGQGKAP